MTSRFVPMEMIILYMFKEAQIELVLVQIHLHQYFT